MDVLRAAFAALVYLVPLAPTHAQTTAGSGVTVIIPVTAQTPSFQSEVTVHNPNAAAIAVDVAFYEANSSSAPGPKTCANLALPANRSAQFSLATQCPLTAGSHFGTLVLTDLAGSNAFYAYARTQNPQGIGFSTEGFPVGNFNNQVANAAGLKRQAAYPAYQTNCFVGSLDQPAIFTLKLFDGSTGAQLGTTLSGSLGAFQQVRYLDVFTAAGASATDHLNVRAEFTPTNGANLVGFCTVQDNTSFGADFRIAKSYGSPMAFTHGGSSFGATAILGTNDNNTLDIRVNGARVMRYAPNPFSPNVVGGYSGNSISSSDHAQTIAGGGVVGPNCYDPLTTLSTHTCANVSLAAYSAIGGGQANTANFAAVVSGGASNLADGNASTVGGGFGNVGLGSHSTIPGGYKNEASGVFSFAAGNRAKAKATGMFAWADGLDYDFDFSAYRAPQSSDNTFNVRSTGGVVFVTAVNLSGIPTWQCYTYSGAGWICSSDRNLKKNLRPVDARAMLERLVAMPVYRWQPKDGPNQHVEHLGPTAQDFMAAFHVGDSDKAIGSQDADGVALAAIQGLNAKLEEREAALRADTAALRERVAMLVGSVRAKDAEVAELREQVAALRSAVDVLVARTTPDARMAVMR